MPGTPQPTEGDANPPEAKREELEPGQPGGAVGRRVSFHVHDGPYRLLVNDVPILYDTSVRDTQLTVNVARHILGDDYLQKKATQYCPESDVCGRLISKYRYGPVTLRVRDPRTTESYHDVTVEVVVSDMFTHSSLGCTGIAQLPYVLCFSQSSPGSVVPPESWFH